MNKFLATITIALLLCSGSAKCIDSKTAKLQMLIGCIINVLPRNQRDWPTTLSSNVFGLTASLFVHFTYNKTLSKYDQLSLWESLENYFTGATWGNAASWFVNNAFYDATKNQIKEDYTTIKNNTKEFISSPIVKTQELYQQFMANIRLKSVA